MDTFTLLVIAHFYASLTMHSVFLHRYGTHQQFEMSRGWERCFFVLTWLLQGPSFLNPTAYAKMHLQHHEHSDTKKDPHSPLNFTKDKKYGLDFPIALTKMMIATKKLFEEIRIGRGRISRMYRERRFPTWAEFEGFADSSVVVLLSAACMIVIYYFFAEGWQWILLPITILNGPIQGAIVNWCGHMWGTRNYTLNDNSRNTPGAPFMLGELFQNNHHNDPNNPNFGYAKWYEIDPIYPLLLFLNGLRIIRLKTKTV